MRKRRAALWLVLLLVFLAGGLYLFRRPALTRIGVFLIVTDPLERSDAIAILGGHSGARGQKAAELFHQGWAPRIVLLKEDYPFRQEELRRYGIQELEGHEETIAVLKYLKVPEASIELLDRYNESTADESVKYLAYAKFRGWKRLIVITCGFHTRRARMLLRHTFRGSGIRVSIQPALADYDFDPNGWWTRRVDSKTLLWEYEKLAFATFRYW